MSDRYLFVTCPTCGKTEMVYVGEVDADEFSLDSLHVTTMCDECVEEHTLETER